MADPAAYWSTIAQLTAVFGFAVGVEARRLVKHWATVRRRWRLLQTVVTAAAAYALVQAFSTSLSELSAKKPDLAWAPFINLLLTFVAIALISNPVITLATAVNADTWLPAIAAIARPKDWLLGPVRARRLERRASRLVVDLLRQLEESEELARTIHALGDTVRKTREAWNTIKALPAEQRDAALEAASREPGMEGLRARSEADDIAEWAAEVEKVGRMVDTVLESQWDRLCDGVDAHEQVRTALRESTERKEQLMNTALKEAVESLEARSQ